MKSESHASPEPSRELCSAIWPEGAENMVVFQTADYLMELFDATFYEPVELSQPHEQAPVVTLHSNLSLFVAIEVPSEKKTSVWAWDGTASLSNAPVEDSLWLAIYLRLCMQTMTYPQENPF